jgi:hypothetical protein
MAEMLTQISALDDLIVQGRFGCSLPQGPGVTLALVHPCEVVTIIAAKGKARALAAGLKTDFGLTLPGMGASATARGVSLHGTAPDQWLAVAPGASAGSLAARLEKKLGALAMICDQSHGRTVMAISGHPDRACGRDDCVHGRRQFRAERLPQSRRRLLAGDVRTGAGVGLRDSVDHHPIRWIHLVG